MKSRLSDLPRVLSKEVTQKRVNDVIDAYAQKLGAIAPPMSEKTLCEAVEELAGIRIECQASEKLSIFEEGLLIPVRRGFVIQYRVLDHQGRPFPSTKIRETICHELAHILFYDCNSPIPQLPMIPPEHVCHNMARQLLAPERVLRKRFSEVAKPGVSLVRSLRQLSSEFRVALWIMAQRLTEDLSLIEDTMITFWKYKNKGNDWFIFIEPDELIDFKDFHRDSRLCPQLKELLPKYWRNRVHMEAWANVVSKVVLQGRGLCQSLLCVQRRRQKMGKIRGIPFDIECEPWAHLSNQLVFEWKDQKQPIYNVVSLEKFDLHALQGRK